MAGTAGHWHALSDYCYGRHNRRYLGMGDWESGWSAEPEENTTAELVSRHEFCNFVAKCGPLADCVRKAIESFFVDGVVAPWFHGHLSRMDTMRALDQASKLSGTTLLVVVALSLSLSLALTHWLSLI